MKKKILISSIIIILIIVAGVLFYGFKRSSIGGGSSYNESNTNITVIDENYRFVTLNLSIDNTKCKNPIQYIVKNPKEVELLEGTIEAGEYRILKPEKFSSMKGEWKIEIIKEKEEEYCEISKDYMFANK